MSQKPGSFEHSSLLLKLEAVKSLIQPLFEVVRTLPETNETTELIRCADLLAEIDFEQLIDDANELVTEATQPSALENFNHEIDLREQKMHEFKLSLADSVIDLKNAQKTLLAANERNAELAVQVSRMQVHSKELSLKLSSTTTSLEKHESELDAARSELDAARSELEELKSRAYQLKNQNAEYENHIKKSDEQVRMALEKQNASLSTSDKAQKDLVHVLTSNNELKAALNSLELREKDLVEAVDSLQKERNHLQGRLNAILTGVSRTVAHSQTPVHESSSSVLEPACLPPYLPFCFPERLPIAIKLRREIAMSFPANYSRRAHRHPTTFLNLEKSVNPTQEAIRTQNRSPRIKLEADTEMTLRLRKSALTLNLLSSAAFEAPDHSASLPLSFAIQPSYQLVCSKHVWWQKIAKLPGMNLKIDRQTSFSIITNSLDLFLNFLVSTFARKNYSSDKISLQHATDWPKAFISTEKLNFSINFKETLAFRHRLQLKSTKLDAPRITLLQSFKRGNKLKSVLEMFGNTISSIVHRFESIPNSRSDNGENK